MPTEPAPVTLAEVVRVAVEACDDGSAGLEDVFRRFEDADEPIRGLDIEQRLDTVLGPPELDEDDPAVTMARAVIIYLAHRRDEVAASPAELLRLAARAEFHGEPPDNLARWLDEQGITNL